MALFAKIRLNKLLHSKIAALYTRSCSSKPDKKGLVLGVYSKKDQDGVSLTSGSKTYNKSINGGLVNAINLSVIH